jgi:zinc D-Ala-D-Ala carboxypeptidase
MNLSRNFTLQELTKSDTAVRLGVDNNPNANQIEKLKLLCENILQPVRDHFGPVTITSGFRSPALCVKIGSSINSVNIHRVVLLISNVWVKTMPKSQIGFIKT